jgi:hypothetical protein
MGSTRVYIAPCLDHSEIARTSNDPDNQRANFALVDGIFTSLAGEPWPDYLVVNLTEDLSAKLTVDRRQADPPAATMEPVLHWTRENGGAALASWSAPEFLRLHEILIELDPKVTACADAILRETVGSDMIMPELPTRARLPLSVGLSDLDPEIVTELTRALDPDDLPRQRELMLHRERMRQRGLYSGLRRDGLSLLSLRASPDSSIDPIVIQGMFHRTKELADAGLVLPNWLQQAVSFETSDESGTFPAAYRPAVAALDAQRQVGLAAHWTSDNRNPEVDVEHSSWNDEALSRLNEKQLTLISRDLDGVHPFLTNIRTTQLWKFLHHPKIRTPARR